MENPSEIQHATPGSRATPLVLMHDGGGTAYEYHLLGPLDREVWGITNPNFDSGEPFAGGIPAQAAHYISLIRGVIPSGNILLGGWSLGGLLSLEMARQLVGDEKLKVKGIVMVDSVFPVYAQDEPQGKTFSNHKPEFNSYTSEATKVSVTKSFANTFEALKTWKLPDWTGHEVPRTLLIRCKQFCKTDDGSVKRVDTFRNEPLLGWEQYPHKFIDGVTDLDCSHYVPFKMNILDTTTSKIKAACNLLDNVDIEREADVHKFKKF